jgi:hypothetical protein
VCGCRVLAWRVRMGEMLDEAERRRNGTRITIGSPLLMLLEKQGE